uniref:Dirigent protein n=1 Tax=Kadsura heteroclita TaxID=124781 RepID=A0A7U3VH27_9MAGN|nr:dirigent protein 12 [Kadsura heteroclita]
MARMSASTKSSQLFFVLLLAILVSPEPAVAGKPPKITRLQFYMHDIHSGQTPTAVRVAPSQPLNFSGENPMFGSVYVADNQLTVSPDINSTLVGRAQGIYAMASLGEDMSLHMMLTYTLQQFNDSSFSVIGRNPVMSPVREFPIYGGTGVFRLARGYCFAQTNSTSGPDAVVGYNVTLFHY